MCSHWLPDFPCCQRSAHGHLSTRLLVQPMAASLLMLPPSSPEWLPSPAPNCKVHGHLTSFAPVSSLWPTAFCCSYFSHPLATYNFLFSLCTCRNTSIPLLSLVKPSAACFLMLSFTTPWQPTLACTPLSHQWLLALPCKPLSSQWPLDTLLDLATQGLQTFRH